MWRLRTSQLSEGGRRRKDKKIPLLSASFKKQATDNAGEKRKTRLKAHVARQHNQHLPRYSWAKYLIQLIGENPRGLD